MLPPIQKLILGKVYSGTVCCGGSSGGRWVVPGLAGVDASDNPLFRNNLPAAGWVHTSGLKDKRVVIGGGRRLR